MVKKLALITTFAITTMAASADASYTTPRDTSHEAVGQVFNTGALTSWWLLQRESVAVVAFRSWVQPSRACAAFFTPAALSMASVAVLIDFRTGSISRRA